MAWDLRVLAGEDNGVVTNFENIRFQNSPQLAVTPTHTTLFQHSYPNFRFSWEFKLVGSECFTMGRKEKSRRDKDMIDDDKLGN